VQAKPIVEEGFASDFTPRARSPVVDLAWLITLFAAIRHEVAAAELDCWMALC
jgi:hypothetical protein